MTDQEKIELLQKIVNEYRARTREVSRIAAQAPPRRQENDDVFPGFRGNNDSG